MVQRNAATDTGFEAGFRNTLWHRHLYPPDARYKRTPGARNTTRGGGWP
jgi:hypothetical protein